MADNKIGTLRVGLTPERGIPMFMGIYPAFYAKYPNITIEPLEVGVKEQLSRISKGYLDLGFVTITERDRNTYEYIHVLSEDLVLAIPRSPGRCPRRALHGDQSGLFQKRPFCADDQGIYHEKPDQSPVQGRRLFSERAV